MHSVFRCFSEVPAGTGGRLNGHGDRQGRGEWLPAEDPRERGLPDGARAREIHTEHHALDQR